MCIRDRGIDLLQQVGDDIQLISDLSAAQNSGEGTDGVVEDVYKRQLLNPLRPLRVQLPQKGELMRGNRQILFPREVIPHGKQ